MSESSIEKNFRVEEFISIASINNALYFLQVLVTVICKDRYSPQVLVKGLSVEASTRELDLTNAAAKDCVLADLDESLKALLVFEDWDSGEAEFAESFGGKCVNTLSFAGETQRVEIFLPPRPGSLQILETTSGGSEENEAGGFMVDVSAIVSILARANVMMSQCEPRLLTAMSCCQSAQGSEELLCNDECCKRKGVALGFRVRMKLIVL